MSCCHQLSPNTSNSVSSKISVSVDCRNETQIPAQNTVISGEFQYLDTGVVIRCRDQTSKQFFFLMRAKVKTFSRILDIRTTAQPGRGPLPATGPVTGRDHPHRLRTSGSRRPSG